MTEDITAKIAAKGCTKTGVSETDIHRLHTHLGTTIVIVAEVSSTGRTEKADGTKTVQLALSNIQVAPSSETEDHLRELARTFDYNRRIEDRQEALDLSLEPKMEDVLAAGEKHRPHPYLSSSLALDGPTPVCDICGFAEGAAAHHVDQDDSPTDTNDDDSNDDACADCGHLLEDCACDEHDEPEATVTTLPNPTVTNPFTPTSA